MASIFYLLLYYFIYFIYYNSAISRSRDKKYYVLDIYIYIYIKVRYNNFCVSQYFFLLSLITIRSLLHETSILLKRTLFFFFFFFLRSLLFFFSIIVNAREFFSQPIFRARLFTGRQAFNFDFVRGQRGIVFLLPFPRATGSFTGRQRCKSYWPG